MQRRLVPELMDAPDLPAADHALALAGLRRLNRAARAPAPLARALLAHLGTKPRTTPVRLLDVACGSADVPLAVAASLRTHGINLHLTLSDRSPTALAQAQAAADRIGIAAHSISGEAPHALPAGLFDAVTNSLFLHHLTREQAIATLRAMADRVAPGGILVVADLRRGLIGYGVAWVMCRVLSRSPIVHFDGPVSVQAAWTVAELRALAAEAGLAGAQVRPCWPWRMLLSWSRRRA